MAERMPCGHYPTDDGTCDDPYCRKPMAALSNNEHDDIASTYFKSGWDAGVDHGTELTEDAKRKADLFDQMADMFLNEFPTFITEGGLPDVVRHLCERVAAIEGVVP